MTIFDTVRELVQNYCTNDPFELCECLGVKVKVTSIGQSKGLYTYVADVPVIIISDKLRRSERIIVCSHELGHHVLHAEVAANDALRGFSFYNMRDKTEYEANIFMADLLIDNEELDGLFIGGSTIEEASAMLRLPSDIVRLKMEDMNRRGWSYDIPMGSACLFGR